MLLKLPWRAERIAIVVELRELHLHAERLAMLLIQSRLGIERIDLARPAVHVQKDYVLGPRLKMRRLRRERIRRRCRRSEWFIGQQCGQRHRTEAAAGLAQECPAA